MTLTSGYELTTAITNIFIFVVSLFGFFKIKNEKLWKFFFLLMSIDSFMGVIVHGISMSKHTNDILWAILSLMFTITINTMICIFMKLKIRHIICLSVLLTILLLTQLVFDMNFILTFTLYVLMTVLLSVYYILKDNYERKHIFLLGFIILVIGGVLMLSHVKVSILDHNGICHLFMAFTLILFLMGINYKEKLCYDNGGE